jgi:hypothetical protein
MFSGTDLPAQENFQQKRDRIPEGREEGDYGRHYEIAVD